MQQIILDRRPAVEAALGKKRSALYQDISAGLMTPPVQIGYRAVAWPRHEHQAIAAARVAGKTTDELRALVAQLVAQRAKAA